MFQMSLGPICRLWRSHLNYPPPPPKSTGISFVKTGRSSDAWCLKFGQIKALVPLQELCKPLRICQFYCKPNFRISTKEPPDINYSLAFLKKHVHTRIKRQKNFKFCGPVCQINYGTFWFASLATNIFTLKTICYLTWRGILQAILKVGYCENTSSILHEDFIEISN